MADHDNIAVFNPEAGGSLPLHCPLYGADCVGPERCAPGVLWAEQMDLYSGNEPGTTPASCPITHAMVNIQAVASAMPLLHSIFGADIDPDPTPPEEEGLTKEELARHHAIAKANADQDLDGGAPC